jgi:membrane-associated phospholipid phosphatase
VEGSTERSVANAERLLALEARLGLDIEARIQSLALDNDLVREIGNLSYVWLHWPLLLTALVVLVVRDERRYRQLRDALFVSGAVGLVLFTVLPMAPPRFMPGFVGTVSDDARRHHLDYPIEWANRYAAFPSFHVGWTLIACLAVAATLAHRHWRVAALVPAALVGISVVTTGNHYLLDAIAGGVIALTAYLAVGRWHRANVIDFEAERETGGDGERRAGHHFRTDAPGVMIRP